MARSKTQFKDAMGAHARLYAEIAEGPAWAALGYSSRALYVQLRVRLKATNNGNIESALSTLKQAGFNSSSTVAKALRELEVVGLIAKTRQGGIAAGGKSCSLYRFTDQEVYENLRLDLKMLKATHEWRQWKSWKEAAAAIRAAHASAQRPARPLASGNEVKVPKSKRVNSKIKAAAAPVSSISEYRVSASVQKPKLMLVAAC